MPAVEQNSPGVARAAQMPFGLWQPPWQAANRSLIGREEWNLKGGNRGMTKPVRRVGFSQNAGFCFFVLPEPE
jgi:hypothetical protein